MAKRYARQDFNVYHSREVLIIVCQGVFGHCSKNTLGQQHYGTGPMVLGHHIRRAKRGVRILLSRRRRCMRRGRREVWTTIGAWVVRPLVFHSDFILCVLGGEQGLQRDREYWDGDKTRASARERNPDETHNPVPMTGMSSEKTMNPDVTQ